MNLLEPALRLNRLGQYAAALRALDQTGPGESIHNGARVLRAELLEQVGESTRAVELARAMLKTRQLTTLERCQCEALVGRVLVDEGDTQGGLAHFQRAALIAQQGTEPQALFLIKLAMLDILSDRSGPAAGTSILAEVRQIATSLGDAQVTGRLHLFVAQIEARRGLLENANRHTLIARRILASSPNTYLEAFGANLELACALLRCEFDRAKDVGIRAINLAEQSGAAKVRSAAFGNMGNLFLETGEFDQALEYFEKALAAAPTSGTQKRGTLDSMARVYLRQNRFDLCLAALDAVDESMTSDGERQSYERRYAALTRLHLLARQGNVRDALEQIGAVLHIAERAGDGLLEKQVQLTKADFLQRSGEIQSSTALLAEIVPGLIGVSPDFYAHSEQILGCALAATGEAPARTHYERARRIYQGLGSIPKHEVNPSSGEGPHNSSLHNPDSRSNCDSSEAQGIRTALHGVAAAFAYATRPDLVVSEFLELITAADCVLTARATVRPGATKTTDSGPLLSASDFGAHEQRLSVGLKGDREVELHLRTKTTVESVATINAITLLLGAVQEVQRARAEREEQATLWPLEELPDDARSVLAGRMRQLMKDARKIAPMKVNVLITGESGTGKEILARAIHDFSDRAKKPFVPFNCTAIPRDLLESQLFGHRRGAFTGADRDQLGLIRSAREGTLFLDEVGELGLDLQPKLLRFLESGEIAPLGEPGSMTVDVRIVAATNANLEDAVRAGRFREDLFYRLNVVRLTIPPLRERRDEIPALVNHFVGRAAVEFDKGQLRIADETMERLLLYRWPGNVRQLQNEVRRIVALAERDSTLLPDAISEEILGALPIVRHTPVNGSQVAIDLRDTLPRAVARVESELIAAALKTHRGKVDAAAKALGISRKGLYLKRQRLGL